MILPAGDTYPCDPQSESATPPKTGTVQSFRGRNLHAHITCIHIYMVVLVGRDALVALVLRETDCQWGFFDFVSFCVGSILHVVIYVYMLLVQVLRVCLRGGWAVVLLQLALLWGKCELKLAPEDGRRSNICSSV